MLRASLFPKIREKTVQYLNGYIPVPAVSSKEAAETLIVPSPHGNDAGIIGALTLAQDALGERSSPCRLSIVAAPSRRGRCSPRCSASCVVFLKVTRLCIQELRRSC